MRSFANTVCSSSALVVTAALVGAIASSASAYLPPSAAMNWTVDGGALNTLSVTGTQTLSGNYAFVKTVNSGTTKVTFNYVADINPSGNALINGSTTFENLTNAPIVVETNFDVSICPTVSSSLIGGIASVKLICNSDGGLLLCGSNSEWLATAASDGVPTNALYYCPFALSKTGAGTSTSNTNFGLPIPSSDGPGDLSSLGHSTSFQLSAGDKVVFTLMYATNGFINEPALDPCPGDVNSDGIVNKDDLLEILALFGQPVACGNVADADGNGLVDAGDLGMVTGYWGQCD